MAIKSNLSIAGGVSASFSQSASLLASIAVSVQSGQTNVAGTSIAEASLTTMQTNLKALSASIVSAGNNIHSVAAEFERIDQKIAQLPSFTISGGVNK